MLYLNRRLVAFLFVISLFLFFETHHVFAMYNDEIGSEGENTSASKRIKEDSIEQTNSANTNSDHTDLKRDNAARIIQAAYRAYPERLAGFLKRSNQVFVTIPEGYLPKTSKTELIPSFEMMKFPVTRAFWRKVMRGMPAFLPDIDGDDFERERSEWNNCLSCPVTHVKWDEIQMFLKNLNKFTSRIVIDGKTCSYDLPTDDQLWYSIRGDVSSLNQDPYSAGVTDENINKYITYGKNTYYEIQPIGKVTPNRFGIELGNVWKLTKDLYEDTRPDLGRSIRGGGWGDSDRPKSDSRFYHHPDDTGSDHGFTLVRHCVSQQETE